MSPRDATLRFCMQIMIIMCAVGTGSKVIARVDLQEKTIHAAVEKEISVLRLPSADVKVLDEENHHKHHKHDQMSHMVQKNPSLNVFLVEKELEVGRVMPIYFPKKDPSSYPQFLPREQAVSIPFSSAKLPYLLRFFAFARGSHEAQIVETTLRQCELAPIEGESSTCATSLESMIDFTRAMFGVGTKFRAVSTIHRGKTTISQTHPALRNYTMLKILELSAGSMVACHTMPYPYTVYYCHHLNTMSKVFRVTVIGEYDDEVDAVVVCHMDTSRWNPDHISFRVLGIKPGTDPVCHFFPADHLVWIPSTPPS